MSYVTVGTIKSINLSEHTFKLEPISKYRFELKDGDENSWKIVFAVESRNDPDTLKLVSKDMDFSFEEGLESAMIVLKQGKGKIKLHIEEAMLTSLMELAKDNVVNVNAKNEEEIGKGGEEHYSSGNDSAIKVEVL